MPAGEPVKMDSPEASETLLGLIHDLIVEVNPGRIEWQPITLDSTLDGDAGLDSLSKMELLSRIEGAFDVSLLERVFSDAETPRDLLRAIEGAEKRDRSSAPRSFTSIERQHFEGSPTRAQTLTDVLQWHVERHPDRTLIQFYVDSGEGEVINFRRLQDSAVSVAEGLRSRGVEPGEPVVVILPTGSEYFYCFMGILYAGGIPVPMYPPARWRALADHIQRHNSILGNCGARNLITSPEGLELIADIKGKSQTLRQILTVEDLLLASPPSELPVLAADDTAFLQYTSGSTGDPKGVVLTHANLLSNIRAMGEAVKATSSDVFVSWLPLYHDMGLIGAWMASLYFGMTLVLMPPPAFLAKPERWLWAIHRYRGTLSAAPNFAYDQCVRRIDEVEIADLDLSSWRVAFNGAEPVSAVTLGKFNEKFGKFGFKPESLMPVYGLAECSVGLAFPPLGRETNRDRVNRISLQRKGVATAAEDGEERPLTYVSSGRPLPNHEIRIVDDSGRELPDRQVGRVQFRGPSATSGYYKNVEETRRLFDGNWRNTGDLGYIAHGELYVSGREKDVIIKAGRNLYPQELEEVVSSHPDIITGNVAVFGGADPATGSERLIVLAETRKKSAEDLQALRSEVNALVSDLIGSPPDDVVLAPPRSVLKTSSGKVRRAASRAAYEQRQKIGGGRIHALEEFAIRWSHIQEKAEVGWRSFRALLYASGCWLLFGIMAPPVWLAVVANPVPAWRWTFMQIAGRFLSRIACIPLRVAGLDRIPRDQPCILVSNHASYLDVYVLTTLLPPPVGFVAKAELWDNPLIGAFLSRINTQQVERFDHQKGLDDFRALAANARKERTLIFFPEGTFSRMPGLLPFQMGAFVAAAEAAIPIIPIAIRGTRSILRADSWFPRKCAVSLNVGLPIDTRKILEANDHHPWSTSIALRDQSREWILRHCAEPDLSHEVAPIFARPTNDQTSSDGDASE